MLLREASKGILGSRELSQALKLPVKARRVRQIMNHHPKLTYKKIKRVPPMPVHRKTAFLAWATENVAWTIPDWKNVVWSDEKVQFGRPGQVCLF